MVDQCEKYQKNLKTLNTYLLQTGTRNIWPWTSWRYNI